MTTTTFHPEALLATILHFGKAELAEHEGQVVLEWGASSLTLLASEIEAVRDMLEPLRPVAS